MPVDFWDAIQLFASSQTGRGKGPDEGVGLKGLATDVVRKLRELHSQGRIHFAPMPEGEEGEAAGEGAARVVRVNQACRDNLAMTSTVAVHEAAHIVLSWNKWF